MLIGELNDQTATVALPPSQTLTPALGSSRISNAMRYPVDQAFSIPIHHGSLERSSIAAQALLNQNIPSWIMDTIKIINDAMVKDAGLKYLIRQNGIRGIPESNRKQINNFQMIERFYKWLEVLLKEKEEEESEIAYPKFIYEYLPKTQEYICSNIKGNNNTEKEVIKLREVKGGPQILYDILIPKI